MVKHTRKLDIFSSLPHVRGCASSKPSLTGPNSETCIGQSPRWISQQGALSRAEEFNGPSLEKGTECKAGCLDSQFFMRSLGSKRNSGEIDGDVDDKIDDEVDSELFDEAMSALANKKYFFCGINWGNVHEMLYTMFGAFFQLSSN
jgi:hypothetical protein